MEWAFRIRFQLSPRSRLGIDEHALEFETPEGVLHLEAQSAGDEEPPIRDADMLVLKGTASSEEEARARGARVLDALQLALSRKRVAADLGRLEPGGVITEKALEMIGSTPEAPILNDFPGPIVYPAEPKPLFMRLRMGGMMLVSETPSLADTVCAAMALGDVITDRERTAYDLFAVSLFDSSPDARLISLVMAIETLVDQPERDEDAQAHVRRLMHLTREADLPAATRDSFLGSLQWMLRDSISASGERFVLERLAGRTYGGEWTPGPLWREAYNMRSDLVHGAVPRPTRQDVGAIAAPLEVMVAELLSGDLLTFEG